MLGKDYQNDVYYQQNKPCFDFQGETYEAIGIIGLHQSSQLDKMVFVNLNSATSSISDDVIWAIDSYSNRPIDIDKINSIGNSIPVHPDNSGVARLVGNSVLLLITQSFYMSVIFMMIFATFYFVSKNEKFIRIYQLIGFTPGQIIAGLFKRTMAYILGGLCTGLLSTALVIYQPYYRFDLSIKNLLLALSASIVVYLAFIGLVLRKSLVNSLKNW